MGNIGGKKDKKESKELDEKDNHGQWPGNPQQTKNPSGKRCICAIIVRRFKTSVPSGKSISVLCSS